MQMGTTHQEECMGHIKRHKARLVVKGYSQVSEYRSTIASLCTYKLLIYYFLKYKVRQLEILFMKFYHFYGLRKVNLFFVSSSSHESRLLFSSFIRGRFLALNPKFSP